MRKVKWVGDPSFFNLDGKTIRDWKYENRRVIALVGICSRTVTPYDSATDIGIKGLTQTYVWGGRGKPPSDYILSMDELDAELILLKYPFEFKDVTDAESPEEILNDRYAVPLNITVKEFMGELVRRWKLTH